jgi:hypothetical protein
MAVRQWEQQDDEPAWGFTAFMEFLKIPRDERTIAASYFKYHERERITPEERPPGSYYENARKWRWEARALAWDREQDRKILAKLGEKRLKSLLETAELGETLRKKAASAARMITSVTQSVGTHDGREAVILATNLTPMDIVRMAEVGVKIEQLAVGNPTDRLQHGNDPENPMGTVTLETAKEVLRQRLDEVKKRRAAAEE